MCPKCKLPLSNRSIYPIKLASTKTTDWICIGGMPLFPYGMRQIFYMLLSINIILIFPSKLMLQGHGAVVHSSALTSFSMLGLLNRLQLILWLKSWYPSSLAVPSGPHYSHTRKFNFNVIIKAWSQPSTKDHPKTA